jgi:hypothetical protein
MSVKIRRVESGVFVPVSEDPSQIVAKSIAAGFQKDRESGLVELRPLWREREQ